MFLLFQRHLHIQNFSVVGGSLIALIFLGGCQPSTENGLLSDYEAQSQCPMTGCVDTAVSSAGLMMSINSSTRSTDGQSRAEVVGRCSPAAYPDNRIVVSVSGPGGASANTQVYGIQPNSSDIKCVDGKFHIAFDTANFAASQRYRVTMTLQGIRNGTVTPETSSYSQVSFDLNKN
jgi:hypothetical protein